MPAPDDEKSESYAGSEEVEEQEHAPTTALEQGNVGGSGGHNHTCEGPGGEDGYEAFAAGGPAGLEDGSDDPYSLQAGIDLDAAVRSPKGVPPQGSQVSRAASLKSSSGRRLPFTDQSQANVSQTGMTSMRGLLARLANGGKPSVPRQSSDSQPEPGKKYPKRSPKKPTAY